MAAAQWPEMSFIPKQAVPKSAALFESIIGNTSEVVTQHILTSRLLPIAPYSVIHDNGCGTLQVTGELFTPTPLNPSPSANLTVHATDSNGYQIEGARSKADANNWPVQAAIMRAQSLTFPDSTFDISFTNFVIMGLDNRELAAKHVFRTLKPGGSAVVSTWASMPHDLPLKIAHGATRASESKLRIQWGGDLLLESTLKDFYLEGGFEEDKIDIKQFELWHPVKDLAAWAEGLWSFLGDTEEGWTVEDEGRWSEALRIITEEMERSRDFVRSEDGKGGKLRFVAHIGVARK